MTILNIIHAKEIPRNSFMHIVQIHTNIINVTISDVNFYGHVVILFGMTLFWHAIGHRLQITYLLHVWETKILWHKKPILLLIFLIGVFIPKISTGFTTTSTSLLSPCEPINPCGQHGECIESRKKSLDAPRGYACICSENWYGKFCDKSINKCEITLYYWIIITLFYLSQY